MPKRPFGFNTPEESPGFLLWQTTITWQRSIKKVLEPYAISHPQFVIMASTLWFEMHKQMPTQILLARNSRLDKMTVSKALKSLVSQGLVARSESTQDTRAKQVALTSRGKELIHTLVPLVEHIDKDYFSSLSKEEERSFIQCLKIISDAHE